MWRHKRKLAFAMLERTCSTTGIKSQQRRMRYSMKQVLGSSAGREIIIPSKETDLFWIRTSPVQSISKYQSYLAARRIQPSISSLTTAPLWKCSLAMVGAPNRGKNKGDYDSKEPHSTASLKCFHTPQNPPFLQPPCGGRCWILLRCVRKIVNSDYCLRHVCLSTRPHGTRFPLEGLS